MGSERQHRRVPTRTGKRPPVRTPPAPPALSGATVEPPGQPGELEDETNMVLITHCGKYSEYSESISNLLGGIDGAFIQCECDLR